MAKADRVLTGPLAAHSAGQGRQAGAQAAKPRLRSLRLRTGRPATSTAQLGLEPRGLPPRPPEAKLSFYLDKLFKKCK